MTVNAFIAHTNIYTNVLAVYQSTMTTAFTEFLSNNYFNVIL